MRRLGRGILLGSPRPHRYSPEPEAMQQRADRAFGQGDAVALLDHAGEVGPPPAHHAMLGQIWPLPHQLCHLPSLLGR
ncbi:MAG: hypothetical protein AUI13_00665 [Gemmatimonadetes bacterium 13_2_20CM_2_69_23]|nr:MAG: hypothetical protein AUI13_00665 [Gemmatimonadetes bacterium 13_2_20CM_2_69_23]